MARAYICDACGKAFKNPHACCMKEFRLEASYDIGSVFDVPAEEQKTVHLCEECFHALHLIAQGTKLPDQDAGKAIKVKYISDQIEKLDYIAGKSDWIDLRAAEEVELKKGEFKLIPLGIAIQLPPGYEAHIVPRSSTFKNFHIIQTTNIGVIDESYCGDGDQWYFHALAAEDTIIHVNDRICQFRIVEHQPKLVFEAVDTLGNSNRGGFGTTGKR